MAGLVDYVQHKGHIVHDKYQPIFTYLLKCRNWHSYEVTLLSNAIFLADYAVAKVLAKQFIIKFRENQFSPVAHKIPVFFNNLAEMALMNQEPENACQYCALSRSSAIKHHDLFNQLLSQVTLHIADHMLQKKSEEAIIEDLQLFAALGYKETADYYIDLCKELNLTLSNTADLKIR